MTQLFVNKKELFYFLDHKRGVENTPLESAEFIDTYMTVYQTDGIGRYRIPIINQLVFKLDNNFYSFLYRVAGCQDDPEQIIKSFCPVNEDDPDTIILEPFDYLATKEGKEYRRHFQSFILSTLAEGIPETLEVPYDLYELAISEEIDEETDREMRETLEKLEEYCLEHFGDNFLEREGTGLIFNKDIKIDPSVIIFKALKQIVSGSTDWEEILKEASQAPTKWGSYFNGERNIMLYSLDVHKRKWVSSVTLVDNSLFSYKGVL